MKNLIKSAWMARAPMLWVQAQDTIEAVDLIAAASGAKNDKLWVWSPISGWDKGNQDPPSLNPVDALVEIIKSPWSRTVYIANRMGEGLQNDVPFVSALQAARRALAAKGSMLACVVPYGVQPPSSIAQDFISVTLPLPSEEEAIKVAEALLADFFQTESAKQSGLEPKEILAKLTPYFRGLTRFGVEQVTAVAAVASVQSKAIDIAAAHSARAQILATAGLRVINPEPIQLPGLEGITDWLSRFPVNAVVWLDEIEKALAGYGLSGRGDSTGVTQDQLSVLLTTMQEYQMLGAILVGPPGTGKSECAKQAGLRLGVPVVQLDLGALKGSLVGESEQRIRRAMSAISSMGRALIIATSNGIDSVPAELRRRFTLGTWFCDLPSADDRAQIWRVWLDKTGLMVDDVSQLASKSDNYAGSDIATACLMASLTKSTIFDAMKRITPVGVTAAELRSRLQAAAVGKWLDAKTGTVYTGAQTRNFND